MEAKQSGRISRARQTRGRKCFPRKSTQSLFLSSVCLVLCVVMFARNEIIFSKFREHEARVQQLEDKVLQLTSTVVQPPKSRDPKLDQSTRRERRGITAKLTIDDVRQEIRRQIMSLNSTNYCPFKSCSGIRGPRGHPGAIGKRGPRGRRGKRGPRGPKGPPGSIGPPGQHGKRGMIGLPGPRGPEGPKGVKGSKGEPGVSISAPEVIVSPPNLVAKINQSVEVLCSASGNPKPELSWKRDGKQLPSRWDTNKEGRARLRNVQYNDNGNVTCVAKNVLGTDQQDAMLVVQGPPVFVTTPNKTLTAFKSCDITFTCTAHGNPKPKVTWSKSFQSLPDRSLGFSNGTLKVRSLQTIDSGIYMCTAENMFGSLNHVVHLYVSQLPEIKTADCWRMRSNPSSGRWTHNGPTDALVITLNQDTLLVGYRLWGVASGSGSHDVTIRVKDSQGRVLGMKKGIYRTVSSRRTFVVKFSRPVDLKKGVPYTLQALLKGPSTHRGIRGRTRITCNGVTVTFTKSPSSNNGSSPSVGQIPALIFTRAFESCT